LSAKTALTEGFQRWLEAFVASETGRVSPGRKLDPFGTSTRNVDILAGALLPVEAGQALQGLSTRTRDQRLIDMRAMGLIEGSGGTPTLTEMGSQVVDGWRALGIDNGDDAHGLARCIVLAKAGTGVDAYDDMARFWRELVSMRPAQEWFVDNWGLAAAPYLVREFDGYAPFRVMQAAGIAPWDQKADLESWAASMPSPSGWSESRLAVLLRRIGDVETRLGGRVIYCQALEAIRLASREPADVAVAMAEWGVSGA
jgi:hypothetical protein